MADKSCVRSPRAGYSARTRRVQEHGRTQQQGKSRKAKSKRALPFCFFLFSIDLAMPSPRILILYNEPVLAPDHPDYESEREVVDSAEIVAGHLSKAGFAVTCLGAGRDPQTVLARLGASRLDAIVNLYEGAADDLDTEDYMAALLEWLGIPFTGSPFRTLLLARNKHWTKLLLRGAGLPTPAFMVVAALPVPACTIRWPVIVKPAAQDASVGLDQGSVVRDQERLDARVEDLLERYGPPVLVEEFIPGREFNVGLVGWPTLRTLPIAEIVFKEPTPGEWAIVTYDAKWKPGSEADLATPPVCPADVAAPLAAKLETVARQAFRLLGCRDYARVDFRVAPSGEPYILEVNPNPDFHPSAGFARSLAAAGVAHAQFAVELVRAALARGKRV
jgi:D-alanine-D-alanine ligase